MGKIISLSILLYVVSPPLPPPLGQLTPTAFPFLQFSPHLFSTPLPFISHLSEELHVWVEKACRIRGRSVTVGMGLNNLLFHLRKRIIHICCQVKLLAVAQLCSQRRVYSRLKNSSHFRKICQNKPVPKMHPGADRKQERPEVELNVNILAINLQ